MNLAKAEVQEKTRTMEDTLGLFQTADWNAITPLLVKYALFKVNRLEWKSGNVLPKGLLPEDLALNAIRKTCEGLVQQTAGKGVRVWDPVKDPDLLEFLKSVIDSDVNALVMSAEHRLTNYGVDMHDYETHHEIADGSGTIVTGRTARNPEELMMSLQTLRSRETKSREVVDWLYKESKGDEEALLVLMAFEEAAKSHDKVKPQLIARYSGLDEGKIRNAMRRLARKVVRKK